MFSHALGREEHCEQASLACAPSDSATLGLPPERRVCFPNLHCSGSRLLCRELSEAGPGLHAPPRSKPLRFRFSGIPQRRRLGWACVLPPSQVQAAQVTSCLARRVVPVEGCSLSPPPFQPLGFLGVQWARLLRCAVCLFWGAGPWLRPSRGMSTVQNPKKSWLAEKSACSLVSDASLGLTAPFWLWLPSPACSPWGMGRSAAS